MLTLLLLALHAAAAPIDPLPLNAALPTADHSRSFPTQMMLWPRSTTLLDDYDADAVCRWLDVPVNDKLGRRMFKDGDIGYAIVDVTPDAIRIDGEVVVSLTDGQIDDQDKRGMLAKPLYDTLAERAEQIKVVGAMCGNADFQGYLGLAVSPGMSISTVREVLYAAGQAQFGALYFLVEGQPEGPGIHMSPDVDIPDRRAKVTMGSTVSVLVGGTAYPSAESAAQAHTLGCAILAPSGNTPQSVLIEQMDDLLGVGVRDLVFSSTVDAVTGIAAPSSNGTATVHFDRPLSVLPIRLSPVGPPPSPFETPKECTWSMMDQPASLIGAKGRVFGSTATDQGDRPPLPRIELAEIVHGPGLTTEALQSIIRRHANQLSYCYVREQLKNTELGEGSVEVSFTIGGDGKVKKANIQSETFSEPRVGACVVGRVMRFEFPAPEDGTEVTAVQTLHFNPEQ